MTSLFDIEALAKRNLPPDYWDWISSGYGEGMLVRRNQEAFEEIKIRPRPMMDASKVDTSTTVPNPFQYTHIPVKLDEWYFIVATYNPELDEEEVEGYTTYLNDFYYWNA